MLASGAFRTSEGGSPRGAPHAQSHTPTQDTVYNPYKSGTCTCNMYMLYMSCTCYTCTCYMYVTCACTCCNVKCKYMQICASGAPYGESSRPEPRRSSACQRAANGRLDDLDRSAGGTTLPGLPARTAGRLRAKRAARVGECGQESRQCRQLLRGSPTPRVQGLRVSKGRFAEGRRGHAGGRHTLS